MERDRWHQMITIAVIASLVLAIVGIGIGIKALGKTGGTTAGDANATYSLQITPGGDETVWVSGGHSIRTRPSIATAPSTFWWFEPPPSWCC